MARITVEDCLEHTENRFDLVLRSTKRARQLANGAEAMLPWDNDKPTVVALREIAEGLVPASFFDPVEVIPAETDLDAADAEAETGEVAVAETGEVAVAETGEVAVAETGEVAVAETGEVVVAAGDTTAAAANDEPAAGEAGATDTDPEPETDPKT